MRHYELMVILDPSLDERTEQVAQQWSVATAQLQESVDAIAGRVEGVASQVETLNQRDPA